MGTLLKISRALRCPEDPPPPVPTATHGPVSLQRGISGACRTGRVLPWLPVPLSSNGGSVGIGVALAAVHLQLQPWSELPCKNSPFSLLVLSVRSQLGCDGQG